MEEELSTNETSASEAAAAVLTAKKGVFEITIDEHGDSRQGTALEEAIIAWLEALRDCKVRVTFEVIG